MNMTMPNVDHSQNPGHSHETQHHCECMFIPEEWNLDQNFCGARNPEKASNQDTQRKREQKSDPSAEEPDCQVKAGSSPIASDLDHLHQAASAASRLPFSTACSMVPT